MIIEIASSMVASSILGGVYLKRSGSTNETSKIQMIANNCGLISRDGSSIHLQRKTKHEWGSEYAYRMPLGLSEDNFQSKKGTFEDGLNTQRTVEFSFSDLKELNLKKNIIKQIRWMMTKKVQKKEVEISYDGLLKIWVYNEPLPEKFLYDNEMRGKDWKIPVGLSRHKNEVLYHDFEAIPHMSIGGATRYGKSQFLHMMINALITNKPDDVRFTFVDLKGGVEFYDYRNLKQTVSLALEPQEALKSLEIVYKEMRDIQIRQREKGHKNIQQAKDSTRHFIIMDEVGELNPDEAVGKEEKKLKEQCQTYMSQIARLGAGLGYRLILATQYGTGDIIPRQCKQNSDARICFRVRSGVASRVVLDREGAEDLPMVKGRAIYQLADQHKIVQTPLIDDEEIKQTTKPYIELRRDEVASDDSAGTENGANLIISETT